MAVLEKCKVSSRNSIHILSAAAIALGHPLDSLILSRSSLDKYRKMNRRDIVKELQSNYHVTELFLFNKYITSNDIFLTPELFFYRSYHVKMDWLYILMAKFYRIWLDQINTIVFQSLQHNHTDLISYLVFLNLNLALAKPQLMQYIKRCVSGNLKTK